MKRSFLIALIISFFSLNTPHSHALDQTPCKIYTIPKSGTFLIAKYFRILLKREIISKKIWDTTHYYEKNFDSSYISLSENSELKVISLVRDPRDILCSLVDWLEKVRTYAYFDVHFKPQWYLLSKSQKIRLLIDESLSQSDLRPFYQWDCSDDLLARKIHETAERSIKFHSLPQILIVKFEEIIGPRGGGSFEQQKEAFSKINQLCEIEIDDTEFEEILNSLWGKEDREQIWQPTFNQGYIGRWREEFDEETLLYMKKYYNPILIQLGYEKDVNW